MTILSLYATVRCARVADQSKRATTMAQLAAFNTMTAIKKKLHGMKQKREEAFDRADQLEQKLIEHRAVSEKVRLAECVLDIPGRIRGVCPIGFSCPVV